MLAAPAPPLAPCPPSAPAPAVEVVDLCGSDDDAPPARPRVRQGAPPAARAPRPAPAPCPSPDVVIVGEAQGDGPKRRRTEVLDLTREPTPAEAAAEEAARKLRLRNAELEAKLAKAEAAETAARLREARGGVPPHWRPQPSELNLSLRDLPLPSSPEAASPPGESAKRAAQRASEVAEAARALARFAATAAGLNSDAVTRVLRVQSRRLWARYQDRRTEVAESAERWVPGGVAPAAQPCELAFPGLGESHGLLRAANERLLFHGADQGAIRAIVCGGFECRIASMGGALGAGAYFAENASYSHQYSQMPPHAHGPGRTAAPTPPVPAYLRGQPAHVVAAHMAMIAAQAPAAAGGGGEDATLTTAVLTPPPGQLLMIVARVVLGRVGTAVAQGRIAPPGYDSVGDGGSTRPSSIYAVFDNYAAYPEYVLFYDPTRVARAGHGAGAMGLVAGGMGTAALVAAMGLAGPSMMLAPGLGTAMPGLFAMPAPRRKKSRRSSKASA